MSDIPISLKITNHIWIIRKWQKCLLMPMKKYKCIKTLDLCVFCTADVIVSVLTLTPTNGICPEQHSSKAHIHHWMWWRLMTLLRESLGDIAEEMTTLVNLGREEVEGNNMKVLTLGTMNKLPVHHVWLHILVHRQYGATKVDGGWKLATLGNTD